MSHIEILVDGFIVPIPSLCVIMYTAERKGRGASKQLR